MRGPLLPFQLTEVRLTSFGFHSTVLPYRPPSGSSRSKPFSSFPRLLGIRAFTLCPPDFKAKGLPHHEQHVQWFFPRCPPKSVCVFLFRSHLSFFPFQYAMRTRIEPPPVLGRKESPRPHAEQRSRLCVTSAVRRALSHHKQFPNFATPFPWPPPVPSSTPLFLFSSL